MRLVIVFAALLFGAGCATVGFSAPPTGTNHYRYQLIERPSGQAEKGYRLDYDLVSSPHSVIAIISHAEENTSGQWTTVTVDPSCASSMHAQNGEIARVTLWPISAEAAAMNDAFLDRCAPAAVFYPISDILNVSLIQTSPRFALARLHHVGDSARFGAYATHFERLGVAIWVSAPGGETRLSALDQRHATVDWISDPMDLRIIHRAAGSTPEITLAGIERYSFRLVIDARSGVLEHGMTPSDALELAVSLPGVAPNQSPHVSITREVSIDRMP